MKRMTRLHERCMALLVAICIAIAMPAAYAVVKNISIVDNQGNSLANTKVTIVFPDGTEVEEETDDDGMLIYDFPGDGDYTVNYPGGQMAVSVAGGIPTWVWVAGGVAAAGTAWGIYEVVDDDSDNPSSGSSGGTLATGTCSATSFNISTSVVSNPSSHPIDGFDGQYTISCPTVPEIAQVMHSSGSGANAGVTWNCTLDSSGNCNEGPTDCTYNGLMTTCSVASQFSGRGWSGTMSAGLDGMLPGGGTIVVSF